MSGVPLWVLQVAALQGDPDLANRPVLEVDEVPNSRVSKYASIMAALLTGESHIVRGVTHNMLAGAAHKHAGGARGLSVQVRDVGALIRGVDANLLVVQFVPRSTLPMTEVTDVMPGVLTRLPAVKGNGSMRYDPIEAGLRDWRWHLVDVERGRLRATLANRFPIRDYVLTIRRAENGMAYVRVTPKKAGER